MGFNLTFWPQHLMGLRGMPRRVADYDSDMGLRWLNLVSSIGSAVVGVSVLVLLVNLWVTRKARPAGDDPWEGNTLEWATSSPPPPGNFVGDVPSMTSAWPMADQRARERAGDSEDQGVSA